MRGSESFRTSFFDPVVYAVAALRPNEMASCHRIRQAFVGRDSDRPPVRVDSRDVSVALAVYPGIRAVDCVDPRWNDDGGIAAVPGDSVVGRDAVIGTIGCELADRDIDPIEQGLDLQGIAGILIGQDMSNDFAAVGVQGQMQFPPAPTRFGAVLLLQPLTGAIDPSPVLSIRT